MKHENLIKMLFILLITISCKEKNNDQGIEEIKEPLKIEETETENYFYVLINAKVQVDDVFEAYYYEPGATTFSSKDFVSTKVIGSPEFQDIKFQLPNHIYPERLRLDMGKNKSQKTITLNTVSLNWNEKKYQFSRNEIMNEFKPSKFIDFDKDAFTVTTKIIDNRYDPYFYTKRLTNIVDYLLED